MLKTGNEVRVEFWWREHPHLSTVRAPNSAFRQGRIDSTAPTPPGMGIIGGFKNDAPGHMQAVGSDDHPVINDFDGMEAFDKAGFVLDIHFRPSLSSGGADKPNRHQASNLRSAPHLPSLSQWQHSALLERFRAAASY